MNVSNLDEIKNILSNLNFVEFISYKNHYYLQPKAKYGFSFD